MNELYGEALRAAAARPPQIQPAMAPVDQTPHSAKQPRKSLIQGLLHSSADRTQCDEFPIWESTQPSDEVFEIVGAPKTHAMLPAEIVSAESYRTDSIQQVLPASFGQPVAITTISEVFEQTDIREAIQILASQAKASVVVDDTIGGVTSAQIQDESFEQALDKILMPLGLVFARDGERYVIAQPDPDSPLFHYVAERMQFSPGYHVVNSLAALLPPRFKKFLQVSVDRNLIVIEAPKLIANEILERLREMDQPIPQVELEAIVCVVAPDSSFRFGLDWNHVVGTDGNQPFRLGMTGLSGNAAVSGQGFNDAFKDFAVTSAFVRLLAQEGYVTIRAAPRVTAKDGEKANISINRETFFSLQPANSNVFFRQDVQKVEAGISLEITPRVHGDRISVQITKAEVSEDIRSNTSSDQNSANSFPIINRRQVSTDVIVRDGHTIVIGGLVQRQTVDRISKIPFFGSIPVAGKLFQTIEKQEQDAEVAIFISPRIVPMEIECSTLSP